MNSIEKPIRLRFLVRPVDVRNVALRNALISIVSMTPRRAPHVRLRDVLNKIPLT